jgi:ATP-dependent exoDNAse (exonuclease V) beta subunit
LSEKIEKYSFSRLESFHNCKRGYYNTYILKNRGGDNIYSFLGTVCHELTQSIIEKKETNEGAIKKFLEAIEDADMLGLMWMSENVRQNYIECILHFFENYIPVRGDYIHIEDYFEIDVKGSVLRGYIDLWYFLNNELHIIDLKTSSKFSKKDLIHKQRQLILYAYAMRKKYPDKKIRLYFDMLKYANRNNKLIERNKLDLLDDYDSGLVEITFSKELLMI